MNKNVFRILSKKPQESDVGYGSSTANREEYSYNTKSIAADYYILEEQDDQPPCRNLDSGIHIGEKSLDSRSSGV